MTDKRKWMLAVAGVGLVLAAFGTGFYVGALRERYTQAKFLLVERVSINAKLDAHMYDAIRRDNDVIILGCLQTLRSLPPWVARLQSGTPYPEDMLRERAALIKQSLDRSGVVAMTDADILEFVRIYVGKYQTVLLSKAELETLKEKVNEKRQSE
jgi:hypothetical protein